MGGESNGATLNNAPKLQMIPISYVLMGSNEVKREDVGHCPQEYKLMR